MMHAVNFAGMLASLARTARRMAPRAALLAALLGGVIGCGSDPALGAARTTLASATRAVTDLDARLAEGPDGLGGEATVRLAQPDGAARLTALRRTLGEADRLVEGSGRALDLWAEDEGGAAAWHALVPCLALALVDLREQLAALGVEVSLAFEQAVALTASGGGRCGGREVPAQP